MASSSFTDQDQPWLLYHPKQHEIDPLPPSPASSSSSTPTKSLNFFSVSDPHRLVHSFILPTPTFSFVGSGHGMILFFDSIDSSLFLLNTSAMELSLLPPIPNQSVIHRSIIFPNYPISGVDLAVFLIIRTLPAMTLVFAKPGDTQWTRAADNVICMDAVERYGDLIAVTPDSEIVFWTYRKFLEYPSINSRCFAAGDEMSRRDLSARPVDDFLNRDVSLFVVSQGNYGPGLWSVRKEWKQDNSLSVKVYVMDGPVREVTDLRGNSIFVGGGNAGFCVSPKNYPGVRGNCVYFAEQCREGGRMPIGIYNMMDGSVEPILPDVEMEPHLQPAWFLLPSNAKKR